VLYFPPSVQTPLFNKGGDVDFSLRTMGGVEASLCYSPVNHLFVSGLGSWYSLRSDSGEHAYHRYGELGVGTYTTLSRKLHLELSGGYGTGFAVGYGRDAPFESHGAAWEVSGSYHRWFGQFAIAFRRLDTIGSKADQNENDLALVARVTNVRFPRISWPQGDSTGYGWFFEPVLVLRYGVRVLQVEAQVGVSTWEGGRGFEVIDPYVFVGFHLPLHEIF
jgi:hypothetical protein